MPAFFLMIRRPPRSTLFPYRRSSDLHVAVAWVAAIVGALAGSALGGRVGGGPLDRKSTRLNSSHGYHSDARFFFNDTATTEIYTLSLQTLFRSSRRGGVGGRHRRGARGQRTGWSCGRRSAARRRLQRAVGVRRGLGGDRRRLRGRPACAPAAAPSP